jgi:peptide deformylase
MSILKIRYYGDPVLTKVSKPVKEFSPEFETFMDDFIETMHYEDGVGLAAPQVGVNQRFIAVDPSNGQLKEQLLVLVNPVIVDKSKEKASLEEGCLSFPDIHGNVKRHNSIKIKAQDRYGKEIELEAEGFLARILQHEIDHLDGLLFIEKMDILQRQLLSSKLKKLKKDTISKL